jgi:perosamine synthetase
MNSSQVTAPSPGIRGDEPIPLCVPVLGGNEWHYVKECLDTGWVSSVGRFVDRFEEAMGAYIGQKCAVATVNGTAALHVALLVAGVCPKDEVIVSTLTFIAPVNAIRYAGAWPVFVDAEPDYWQMDPERIEQFIKERCVWDGKELRNRGTGNRVKAILPVHILGHPVNMRPIVELAKEYGLAVVEDATESLGARYEGQKVGSIGGIACFSFNGNKLITTGGGGMIVTGDEEWASRARYLTTQAKDDPVEYEHHAIGYNYRLTNVQAALGCAQMEHLDDYVAAKRRIARGYLEALSGVPGVTCMRQAAWAESAFWMFTIRVDPVKFGLESRALLRRFAAAGIQTRPLWQPMHCSRAHAGRETIGGEVAEALWAECLSLPCSVNLTEEQAARVVAVIQAASR